MPATDPLPQAYPLVCSFRRDCAEAVYRNGNDILPLHLGELLQLHVRPYLTRSEHEDDLSALREHSAHIEGVVHGENRVEKGKVFDLSLEHPQALAAAALLKAQYEVATVFEEPVETAFYRAAANAFSPHLCFPLSRCTWPSPYRRSGAPRPRSPRRVSGGPSYRRHRTSPSGQPPSAS